MTSIDDDLMEKGIIQSPQDNTNVHPHKKPTNGRVKTKKRGQGIEIVLKIIHYLIDATMLFFSLFMVEPESGTYPLVFCVGLIIWLGYRIIYFTRGKIIDIIIGLFLFVAFVLFFIFVIIAWEEGNGTIMLVPIVYLGFFCVWGFIRRKQNGKDKNDK